MSPYYIRALVAEIAVEVFDGLALRQLAEAIVYACTALHLQGQIIEQLYAVLDVAARRANELGALIAGEYVSQKVPLACWLQLGLQSIKEDVEELL